MLWVCNSSGPHAAVHSHHEERSLSWHLFEREEASTTIVNAHPRLKVVTHLKRKSNGSDVLEGRVNFSIAHEIIHSFFPNSTRGARFRTLTAEGSREANELERLCDLGAAEVLMPEEEFLAALNGHWGLARVPSLCEHFGSSYEATMYRLATTSTRIALAGLLQYRRRKDEQRAAERALQQHLFDGETTVPPAPKYRRQSLHLSEACSMHYAIPWNKSFDYVRNRRWHCSPIAS